MSFIVAIDGPAGSGKGTITKILSKKMKLKCIDTGAMYRCVALSLLRNNVDLNNIEKIKEVLETVEIEVTEEKDKQIVKLNGEDVTKEIRENPVNSIVSQVSTIKEIRAKLVEMQRKIAETTDIIMEGRDITTVVFPNADFKFYLDASAEERARRRLKQNEEKGINMSYEEILESINTRDYNDTHKDYGALTRTDEQIYIDSTNLTIEEVADIIINKIKESK